MKNLILIRHAKSSWNDLNLSDRDRPLNKRGKRDAPRMGDFLHQKNITPDLMLSSPAKRAYTTAQHIAKALDYPTAKIVRVEMLYTFDFNAGGILHTVKTHADNDLHHTVLVFGHNPTFTHAANKFGGYHFDNVPTCGIVSINFDTNDWQKLSEAKAQGDFYMFPKMLPRH